MASSLILLHFCPHHQLLAVPRPRHPSNSRPVNVHIKHISVLAGQQGAERHLSGHEALWSSVKYTKNNFVMRVNVILYLLTYFVMNATAVISFIAQTDFFRSTRDICIALYSPAVSSTQPKKRPSFRLLSEICTITQFNERSWSTDQSSHHLTETQAATTLIIHQTAAVVPVSQLWGCDAVFVSQQETECLCDKYEDVIWGSN